MIATQTHTKGFREDVMQGFLKEKYWDSWFESEVKMWVEWHEYWMKKAANSSIPIYFFRFEDLLLSPEGILKNMFKFILAKEDLDGSVIE